MDIPDMARYEAPKRWSLKRLADSAFHSSTRPLVLKVAETFLVLIVCLYLTKLALLAMGMHEGYGNGIVSMATYVIDVAMLFITVDSLLSVSSRKPKAWKKVVRAGMLLVIFNIISWFSTSSLTASSLAAMNPVIVTPLAVAIILIMYWGPIRRYYTPLMEDELSVWSWFKFSLFSPLYTSSEYRVMYDDERDRSALPSEGLHNPHATVPAHAVFRGVLRWNRA